MDTALAPATHDIPSVSAPLAPQTGMAVEPAADGATAVDVGLRGKLASLKRVMVVRLHHARWAAGVTKSWIETWFPVPLDFYYEITRSRLLVLAGLVQFLLALIGELLVEVGTCSAGLAGIPESSHTVQGSAEQLARLEAPVEALRWTFAVSTLLATSRWHSPWWLVVGMGIAVAYFVLLTIQVARFCFELASAPNHAIQDILAATGDLVSAMLSTRQPDVPVNYALPAGLVVFVRLLEWLTVLVAAVRMLIMLPGLATSGCLRMRCCGLLTRYTKEQVRQCNAANPDEEVEVDDAVPALQSSEAQVAAAAADSKLATASHLAPAPSGDSAATTGAGASGVQLELPPLRRSDSTTITAASIAKATAPVPRFADASTKAGDKVAWPIAAGARGRDRWPVERPQLLVALDEVLLYGRRDRASWPLWDRCRWLHGMLNLVPIRHWAAVTGTGIVYCCVMTWTAAVLNTLSASGQDIRDAMAHIPSYVDPSLDPDGHVRTVVHYADDALHAGLLAVDSAVVAQGISFAVGLILLIASIFTVASDALNVLLVDDDIRARWDPAWRPKLPGIGADLSTGDNFLNEARSADGGAPIVIGDATAAAAAGSDDAGTTPTASAASASASDSAGTLLSPSSPSSPRLVTVALDSVATADSTAVLPPSGPPSVRSSYKAATAVHGTAGDDDGITPLVTAAGSSASVACCTGRAFALCAQRSSLDAPAYLEEGTRKALIAEAHAHHSDPATATEAGKAMAAAMAAQHQRGKRWYLRGSDPEDPILDLHRFSQTDSFAYIGIMILSTQASMTVLTLMLTAFIWAMRYKPARDAFFVALGTVAASVATKLVIKKLSAKLFIDPHNNIRARRILMLLDGFLSVSFGVMFGGAAGIFRVMVGCIAAVASGMIVSRPIVRAPAGAALDFGFLGYGGMLKARFAWLLEEGTGPVRHISPM